MSRSPILLTLLIPSALAACGGEDDPLLRGEDEITAGQWNPVACRYVGYYIAYEDVAGYNPSRGARAVFCQPRPSFEFLDAAVDVPSDGDLGPNEAQAKRVCENTSTRAIVYGFRGRTKVFLGWSGWIHGDFTSASARFSSTNHCDSKAVVAVPADEWEFYDRFEVVGQSRRYDPSVGTYILRDVPLRLSFSGYDSPQ